jgi:protein-S-isoprenylcysteine O-methyltransferase Ste14
MKKLENRVPFMRRILPPTLLVVSIGLMVLLHFIFPAGRILSYPFPLLGIVFATIGAIISILGSNQFEREKTTIMTFDIPKVLVTKGLYKYSRNPMYLGFALLIIGIWMLLGSLSTIFIVIMFLVLMDRYYISFEENVLQEKFGVAYLEYKKSVRKWI